VRRARRHFRRRTATSPVLAALLLAHHADFPGRLSRAAARRASSSCFRSEDDSRSGSSPAILGRQPAPVWPIDDALSIWRHARFGPGGRRERRGLREANRRAGCSNGAPQDYITVYLGDLEASAEAMRSTAREWSLRGPAISSPRRHRHDAATPRAIGCVGPPEITARRAARRPRRGGVGYVSTVSPRAARRLLGSLMTV